MAPSTPTTAPNVTPIRSRLEDDDTWTLHVGNGDALKWMGSIDTPRSCSSNAGQFMAIGDVALELSPLSGPAWHGEMEFDFFVGPAWHGQME
eukprot:scaffold402_cov49-Attheya_sp.AAC.1